MRLLAPLLLLAASSAWPSDVVDPREIVRRSVARDLSPFDRTKDYTFVQRVEERKLDGKGRVTSTKSETFDVTVIEGRPYSKLVARNDKPLEGKEEAKAAEAFERTLRERRSESAERRAKALANEEKEKREGRALMSEIPAAFDFHLSGEEVIDGRPVWVIEATPRTGYKSSIKQAKMFGKFRGKLWIDKADLDWVRLEAEPVETVSFGWIMARLSPGTRIEYRQSRLKDNVWLPRQVRLHIDAKIALLKRINREVDIDFQEYRRFQSDSRVLPPDAAPPPLNQPIR